ncbi:MAG: TldD/PmbA family protein [Candidatus Muiribacteriota bacterium]
MFKFPSGLYTDVRIEYSFDTKVSFTKSELNNLTEREKSGAFIRIFDGNRWYYSTTTEVNNIQKEINKTAQLAKENIKIDNHPLIQKLSAEKNEVYFFEANNIRQINVENKVNLLKTYFSFFINEPEITMWTSHYIDNYVKKEFYSSKGANLKWDKQFCGVRFNFNLKNENNKFSESFSYADDNFENLNKLSNRISERVKKSIEFLYNAKEIKKGRYNVILSPAVAGVFAHESFGHKSEADFMLNDKSMKNEWKIGKKVGVDELSIVDCGKKRVNGFTPYDDEGTPNRGETYLIKNGKLSGRLHSSYTASFLDEEKTGNARAINFTYEPIVRMTSTYIKPGKMSEKDLFESIKEGIYIETYKHGSGLSTFTIAPSLAYYIKDGKIQYPVKVSVITGNVFETLNKISGLSHKLEIECGAGGGCGKMEQFPLPVGFGGPYVKIDEMEVM